MNNSSMITVGIVAILMLSAAPEAVLASPDGQAPAPTPKQATSAQPERGEPVLDIRRISPSGDGVEPGQQLVIQFNRDMVQLGGMTRNAASLPIRVRPDPGCEWRWLNTSELSCRLPGQAHFAPATRYTVTVGAGLTALDGSYLPQPARNHFETWRPRVRYTRFDEWLGATMPAFIVTTNEPVTAAALAARLHFVRKGASGNDLAASVLPYNEARTGPTWLPVPGHPGAVMEIDKPAPDKPLGAGQAPGKPRKTWKVRPSQALPGGGEYTLHIEPGLKTPLGDLPGTQDEALESLNAYGDFKFKGVSCKRPNGEWLDIAAEMEPGKGPCRPEHVVLLFSAPASRAALQAIHWQPKPPHDTHHGGWDDYPSWAFEPRSSARAASRVTSYALPFGLAPQTTYRLDIPAGVKDGFGRPLKATSRVTFNTGHRTPTLSNVETDAVLEADAETVLPLRFTNLTRLDFKHRQLYANELFSGTVAADWSTTDLLSRPNLAPKTDRVVTGKVGIRNWLDGRSGVVWGNYRRAPGGHDGGVDFMAQVTPYQALAKVGHYDSLLWLSHLDDGTPVAGARAGMLEGHDGDLAGLEPVGSPVTTDAQGLAVLPGTLDLPKAWFNPRGSRANFYVGATRDDNMALLPMTWTYDRYIGKASDYTVWADNENRYGHMRAWAVTNQGIYRPGGAVHYAAFVRDEGASTLQPAAPDEVGYTLTITDPKGNAAVSREQVKLDRYGGVGGTLQLVDDAPMGMYRIQLSWTAGKREMRRQAGHFLVTDFVPASFHVDTVVHGREFGPGDKIKADVKAALHAGGPYTDARVKFVTRLEPRDFMPDEGVAARFGFGDQEALPDARTLSDIEGRLNGAGQAGFSVRLPGDGEIEYGAVHLEGQVQSARATWVTDVASLPYVGRNRFVGLRTKDWVQTAEEPFSVAYIVVDPQARLIENQAVTMALQRREVSRVRVKNGAGKYERQERVDWVTEDRCHGRSAAVPERCEMTPKQAGRYRVLAEVVDDRGRSQRSLLSTWVTGPGRVVWRSDSKGVTLVPDKQAYQPGDIAHVLVQNPYANTVRALVTVERYGILWKKVVKLQGSAPIIDIPIKDSFFPGAYLSVAIFSPRVSPPARPDLGKPELALGYQALKIVGTGSNLDVSVTPAKTEYRPQDTVAVDVQANAADGEPSGKTRLVAAVVDQGVLELLSDGTTYYDPRETFYAPPDGPDMANYSLVEKLLTRLEPKTGKGDTAGGGGGSGTAMRSDFKHAVYWNAALETDAGGHARFDFKVPDNLTRWRILVIAMRPGAAMGLGSNSVRVNLPLQLQPALPNQVHVGDAFKAGFSVTNRTDGELTATTMISATGAIRAGRSSSTSETRLAPFQQTLSWLPLQAGQPGDIVLTARARAHTEAGTLGDAMRSRVPVHSPGTGVVTAEYGSLLDADTEVPIKVPDNALPQSTTLAVTFSPTIVGGLDGAFRHMRDAELRTWEMRLSRAVLAADYLQLRTMLGDSFDWPEAANVIKNTLQAAGKYQAANGGMAYWEPREAFVSKYLSVYTALAFGWLRQAGHTPPAAMEQGLWQYLLDNVASPHASDGRMTILKAGLRAALAAYPDGALPVDADAIEQMRIQVDALDLFGRALFLQGVLEAGDKHRKLADRLVRDILSHADEAAGMISFNERRTDGYAELLATSLRSNCAILDAFVTYHQTYGDDTLLGSVPRKLMRWIAGQRQAAGNGWPNSQENVFCTTATAHYAKAHEPAVESLQGRLLSEDGAEPAVARFASQASPAITLEAAQPVPGEPDQVVLAHGGKGRLYYGVTLHYAMPPHALPAADAGMTLTRHYSIRRGSGWRELTPGTQLERGDIVRVDLIVDTPTKRHHVLLTDPLPGAFEAVNRRLATSTPGLPDRQAGDATLWFDAGPWPNMEIATGGFYHREIGFDAVRFYAESLPAGRYRLVYSAQVIAAGKFIAPAPTVKQVYQPDVFGRGVAQDIDVRLAE